MTTPTAAARFARALIEQNCSEQVYDVMLDSDIMDETERELTLLGCTVVRHRFKCLLTIFCGDEHVLPQKPA